MTGSRGGCRPPESGLVTPSVPAMISTPPAQLKLAMGSWLAADQTSPSQDAIANERAVELANALADLPEAQCQAVTLHHFEGWTLQEVANTSAAARLPLPV